MKKKKDVTIGKLQKRNMGTILQEFHIEAISDEHAIILAYELHTRCGLIGRYYLETSNGGYYQINP
jgi:hypothetical protein